MTALGKINANAELTKEQAREKRDKELRQACAAFEGMFMDMMMKTMRKATMESSLIKKSNGEKIFTEMLDQQYVDILAKTPDSGLGETLYKHLKQTINSHTYRKGRQKLPFSIYQNGTLIAMLFMKKSVMDGLGKIYLICRNYR